MDAIEVFSVYKNLGYKIIPLYPNSKVPMFGQWQKNYSYNKIEKIITNSTEDINFGIILGDVIDLEGDCVESNKILDSMLADVYHPVFSSNKSKHHLFKSSIKNLTKIEFDGIEARGHRHQSVIPPSAHIAGCNYEWIFNIVPYTELPELPEFLYRKIISLLPKIKNKLNKTNLKSNHSKILCFNCNATQMINQKRFNKEMEVFKKNNMQWACMKCRPFDLRKAIKNPNKILKAFS
jgi:hypothetical protein